MNENVFQMGLCMAGAVSAGAYTAGVMDYLLEALDEWERKKQSGEPNIPSHEVKIPVIGGASAGGMTGIITAASVNNPIKPVVLDPTNLFKKQPQNPFYHSWVDLIQDDMFPLMLDTSDIDGKHIYSLLNSKFIDDIAERAVKADTQNWIQRKYIDEHLKVFTTLTNLEGFCRKVLFIGPTTKVNMYGINSHHDLACFKLNTNTYQNDGWIPLNFKNNTNVDIAMNAAMATGAFPIGLRPRHLVRKKEYLLHHPWLKEDLDPIDLEEDDYKSLHVDGGIINNEPFDKVREVLHNITKETEAERQDYNRYKSTVVMIDPFPMELEKFDADERLHKVIGSTLGAMLGHLRTKPSILIDAMNSDCAGQYLIAPSRKVPDATGKYVETEGSKAIACGAMGGFGGFLHKEFRIHDYLLGRANCEKFLMDHFTVPANTTNPIFVQGYQGVDTTNFKTKDGTLQIIPIFKKPKDPFPLATFKSGHDWPSRKEEDIDRFRGLIKDRVQTLLFNTADLKGLNQALLWIGAKVVLNRKITDGVLNAIKGSLTGHKLLSKS